MTQHPFTIQYQEVDGNRKLRLYTLENMILNSASVSADQTGFGIKYLLKQNCTWVLTNLSLEVYYLPTSREHIRIDTWVENARHMLSVRNFKVWLTKDGEPDQLIAQARSVWAVINLNDRTIQNVFDQEVFTSYQYGEHIDIPSARRMAALSDEQTTLVQHPIVYSDIDYNGHCNSCKYLEFMLNANFPQCLNGRFRLELKYAKEMYKDDVANITYWHPEQDPQSVRYELKNAAGESTCSAYLYAIE